MDITTKHKFMTNHGAQIDGNHAPSPPHSTDKRCYQGRFGVTPTRTTQLAFNSTQEDGERRMAENLSMNYTPINNREPTAPEKGHAPWQNSMGRVDNGFERND